MVTKNYILMADIIKSRKKSADFLMRDFKEISNEINRRFAHAFYSPITITLGDEFQSIVRSLKNGVEVIIAFEESFIKYQKNFKLRYVLNFGEIETPINRLRAYEMLGEGLAEGRDLLEEQKYTNKRFHFKVEDNAISEKMNLIFYLYQSVVDGWKLRDFELVSAFLKYKDYKVVAQHFKKDISLMWRREKSLKISEYLTAKRLIDLLI